jgi:putative flavoprotein involved in K+ transport
LQLHSDEYRNPAALPPGAILVVGSGQSGCQITEELYQSGRKVYLCTSSAGRVPRRYRGQDIVWWLDRSGFFDRTADRLPSPKDRFAANPHLSGKDGGHTLNLHQFARDGVTLFGHIQGAQEGKIWLAPNLRENLARSDRAEAETLKMIDDYIQSMGLDAPPEELKKLEDGYAAEVLTEFDLRRAGIATVIWAVGYQFDFSLVGLPVVDDFGYPLQNQGMTAYPGLYFLGLPWLRTFKSGLLFGVGQDAALVATKIISGESWP